MVRRLRACRSPALDLRSGLAAAPTVTLGKFTDCAHAGLPNSTIRTIANNRIMFIKSRTVSWPRLSSLATSPHSGWTPARFGDLAPGHQLRLDALGKGVGRLATRERSKARGSWPPSPARPERPTTSSRIREASAGGILPGPNSANHGGHVDARHAGRRHGRHVVEARQPLGAAHRQHAQRARPVVRHHRERAGEAHRDSGRRPVPASSARRPCRPRSRSSARSSAGTARPPCASCSRCCRTGTCRGLARAAVMNFSIVSKPALGEPTSARAPSTSGVTGVKSRSVS